MKFKITILSFVLFYFFSSQVFSDQSQVSKIVLDNGLTVLIQELPASEVVSIYAGVKTGSAMEGRFLGKGISHFVEHMLFKGTAKRPVGSIPVEVKSLGGVINASTSLDYTLYTLDLPKGLFIKGLDIISDMLMNSAFDANEMEKERKVINGEMSLYNDRPDRMLSDVVFRTVYNQHPYRHPTIGYPNLFETITQDELYGYYKERYIPNNIVLSIAGGFKTHEILPLIKQAFKDFKPAAYIERNLPQELPQIFKRYSEKEYTTNLIRFSLAYQGVSVWDPDLYALDVLSMALGQGANSRLIQEVYKNKHLVEGISAANFTPQDRGIFEIEGSMIANHLDEVLSSLKTILKDIQNNGLTKKELEKTKRQVMVGFIFGNQTASSLAYKAAIDEIVAADCNFSKHYVELIKNVTNEDIKRVANRYLQESHLNVSVLKPKELAAVLTKVEPIMNKGEIKRIVLDNGLTILLHEDNSVMVASVRLTMHGGTRAENLALSGIAQMTAGVWSKATQKRSEYKLASLLEERGASLSSGSSENTMDLGMEVLSEDLNFALDIFEDVIKNPTFPLDAISRQRQSMLTALDTSKDDIMSFSSRALFETFYLKHPLRLDPLGTKETIVKITRKDIINFYRYITVPNNMTISVFGNCGSAKILDVLKNKFGSLKKGNVKVDYFDELFPDQTRVKNLEMDKEQSLLLIAFGAPKLTDENRFGMEIISNILGGGLGGRLFVKIRDELGQAYTTSTRYMPDLDTGTFVLYVLTRPEKVDSVKELVMTELEKLKANNVSTQELQNAKNYLKGSKIRSLLTNSALASTSSSDELNGLGYNFYQQYESKIDAVTVSDIRRLTNTYLDINKAAIVVTKPKVLKQKNL